MPAHRAGQHVKQAQERPGDQRWSFDSGAMPFHKNS